MKRLNNLGKASIGALVLVTAFVMLGAGYLFVGSADALALSARKDTLQTSAFSTLAQHTFVFTTGTALTTDSTATADFSFVLNFPTNAGGDPFGTSVPDFAAGDVTATCTSCGSQVMAVTAVEESSNGGAAANDEFLIAVNETGQDSASLPAASIVTVTFGASTGAQRLTNPANDAAGCTAGGVGVADICRITVQTSEAITGAAPATVDNGDVLVAFIEGVTVSATVSESLSFSITGRTEAECETTAPTWPNYTYAGGTVNATTIGYGTLATLNSFYHACQNLTVSTNAGAGYNVTVEENTSLLSGALTIDDTTCDGAGCSEVVADDDDWTVATNNGFGISCKNDSGTPCHQDFTTAAGDCGAAPCYRQIACRGTDAQCDPGTGVEAATTILTGTSAVNNAIGEVEYLISIGALQEAGTYSNTVTYIATGTF